ncbi:hypothetical protein CBM2606_A150094 [Cupriavidus taiwanensis]|nr:hypothetical protein CBM2606_A150094 [Cupriavidus taiwanensis]
MMCACSGHQWTGRKVKLNYIRPLSLVDELVDWEKFASAHWLRYRNAELSHWRQHPQSLA